MPPVVAAGVITAAGAIAGGVMASRASSRATKAQERANSEAIAYEKETQANRQSRYDAAYADYRKRYDDWLSRYFPGSGTAAAPAGHDVKAQSAGAAGLGVPPAPTVSAGAVPYGTPGGQSALSIADLIRGRGQIQADAASRSGQLWGNTLSGAGQQLGQVVGSLPAKPQAQPTTPPIAGIQPAPDDLAGWSDWRNYIGR